MDLSPLGLSSVTDLMVPSHNTGRDGNTRPVLFMWGVLIVEVLIVVGFLIVGVLIVEALIVGVLIVEVLIVGS